MVRRTSKKSKKIVPSHGIVAHGRVEFRSGVLDHVPGHRIVDISEIYPFIKQKVTGKCAICYSHLTREYPMDYPDEWKFCCVCKAIADEIVKENLKGFIQFRDQADRVKKKITLVG